MCNIAALTNFQLQKAITKYQMTAYGNLNQAIICFSI